jgi:hypothetical protein
MLVAPPRGGKKHNLTATLKKRLATDDYTSSTIRIRKTCVKSDMEALAATVSSKIDDGNIKAALRILTSEDKQAIVNEDTIKALHTKHPAAAAGRRPSPIPNDYAALQVTETVVQAVIKSFPAGSAGGPDGIRPQHIMDMINNTETGSALLTSITNFVNMLLRGECHQEVTPILFGGSLIALDKKSGGVRPIAIGYTLRRIAAKCANNFAISSLDNKLLPIQLSLGAKGGCEAVIHATRRFLYDMPADHIVVKLDFSNAFNSLHRDVMLEAIAENVPQIYRFCHLSYDKTSSLTFFGNDILSQEGVQQGDPLGPLLFCLSIHPMLLSCKSKLKISFMDDITLGGLAIDVASDITMFRTLGQP